MTSFKATVKRCQHFTEHHPTFVGCCSVRRWSNGANISLNIDRPTLTGGLGARKAAYCACANWTNVVKLLTALARTEQMLDEVVKRCQHHPTTQMFTEHFWSRSNFTEQRPTNVGSLNKVVKRCQHIVEHECWVMFSEMLAPFDRAFI